MQKMTRLGECYFDLKGKTRMNDGKRKKNEENERNAKKEINNGKLSNWNKFLSCGLPLLNS